MSVSRITNAHRIALLLNAGGLCAALAAFAYIGTFARHIADDYCSAHLLDGGFFSHLWRNYLTVSDRLSNFVLIGVSEAISPLSVRVLPGLLLALWVVGLTWLLLEASRVAGGQWSVPLCATLGLLLVFYVILLAPNRYQTLYWRSSSAAHLAPLTLMPFLAAWLCRLLRRRATAPLASWIYPLVFSSAFFVGDFSEPANAVLLVLLGMGVVVLWRSWDGQARRRGLAVLVCALGGAAAALLVMAVSPANALRLQTEPPPLAVVFVRAFRYASEFVVDMIRTRPLPGLFVFLTPFLIFLGEQSVAGRTADAASRKRLFQLILSTPVVVWILIAASFSPSVFGQGFPLERARTSGLFFLVAGAATLGGLLGTLVATWRAWHKNTLMFSTAVLLALLAAYPFRAASLAWRDDGDLAQRAALWDDRQTLIYRLKAAGETDLVVPQFGGLEGIKELDVNADHWTNRCAATYYGVASLRAIPTGLP